MPLPRTEIPFVAQTQSGGVVQGATVQVNFRATGTPATIYSTESGAGTLPNPLTTGLSGRADGWLEEGRYNLVVSGPGITTYTQPWDVRSGGNISRFGNATIGDVGPSGQGAIGLGADPSDTVLYRSAASLARLSGGLIVDTTLAVGQAQLVGTAVSFAVQDSVGGGLLKVNFTSAFTDAANIPRLEVGNNTTNNDALISGLTGVALRRLGIGAQGITIGNAASTALVIPTTDTLRVDYAGGRDTLHLASTAAETGITIGGDVELFRSAADVLKTPDTLDANAYQVAGTALASTHLSNGANVGLLNAAKTWTTIQTHTADVLVQAADIRVRQGGDTFDRVRLGWDGLIYFGTGAAAHDVTFRRTGVGALRSSGTLDAAASITANIDGANQVALGASTAGLTLGLAGDTNLYRSTTDTLKTDDTFIAVGPVTASLGAAQVRIGSVGPASEAAIIVGDVTIRRASATNISLDGNLSVNNLYVAGTQTNIGNQVSIGPVVAANELAGQVRIGSDPTGIPTITFGTAEDTAIRRDSASKLRTSNAFQVDGAFTATAGATVSGGAALVNHTVATSEAFGAQNAGVTRFHVLANGTLEWLDAAGLADSASQLVRSAAGVVTLSGIFNANAYRVAGTTLASTHLSDTALLARLADPTFTGTVTTPIHVVTTRAQIPVGSLATPSLAFTGDTDTGIYSPSLGQISLVTDGVARLTATTSGVNAVTALTVGGTAVVLTTDTRLSDVRPPTGTAGGELAGTYPNPSVATGVITNSHIAAAAAIADSKLATISTAGKVADSAISAAIARIASPSFTGVPLAPTAAVDTNNTQLATTAFVLGQAANVDPIVDGTAAVGISTRFARQDHVHGTDTSRAPLNAPAFTGASSFGSTLGVTGATTLSSTLGVTGLSTLTGGATIAGTLAHTGTNLGFYNTAATTRKIGYGSGAQIGTKTTLSAASTLTDVIAVLSSLVADLRTYGLIGV